MVFFEDIMKECNIDDPVEFGKLLRRNRLPTISPECPVNKKDANKIVSRLTGHKLDYYKYKCRERDRISEGPLEQKINKSIKDLVNKWYSKVSVANEIELQQQDRLIGFVCSGGFLKELNEPIFSFKLDQNVNILIGDRGSGKSTMLNLLGVLADSVSEETNVLVTKLLTLFRETPDKLTSINRRVRRILRQYGIWQFAFYFIHEGIVCCYYANLKERIFNFLEQHYQEWKTKTKLNNIIIPSILVFKQGEVIRIAEERNRVYLNNILDALYPDLYQRRLEFVQKIKKLTAQYDSYKQPQAILNPEAVYKFIDKRIDEIHSIIDDIELGYLSEENFLILNGYIEWYNKIQHSLLPTTILKLLQNNEDTFFYLYIGPIIYFLTKSIKDIEIIKRKQDEIVAQNFTNDQLINLRDINHETSNVDFKAVMPDKDVSAYYKLTKDEHNEEQNKESPGTINEKVQTGNESDSFLNTSKTESFVNKGLFDTVQKIAEFLQTRPNVLKKWVKIYSRYCIYLSKSLTALIHNYITLLQFRIALIKEQENKCLTLTNILNKDTLEIKVYTRDAHKTIVDHQTDIDNLLKVHLLYEEIIQATPKMKFREINNLAKKYYGIIEELQKKLKKLCSDSIDPQQEFLFNPIEIELKQGNIYRTFNQLSFGQKSGIILKMVLATTEKQIILIDQPEDNLDANSIVNMLAPSFNRLRVDRQIVIATHDSNLVMGLPISNIVVLESLGENGRIKLQGLSSKRSVVREMIDVLEGGISTFELKQGIYEDFINRVCRLIQDADIAMIESLFRRRTIDGLRNLLQPVISDRAILNILRHELKQRSPLSIRNDILNTKQQIKMMVKKPGMNFNAFIEQIYKLCDRLDTHINRLQNAIEEIRLMDTNARPSMVKLYKLILKIKEDFLSTISKTRDIKIKVDERLQDLLVYADGDHLRLVFHNLFSNSLRATEKRVVKAWEEGCKDDLSEIICIEVIEMKDKSLVIQFSDNGCGMTSEIREKIYIERCSDQQGRNHGLGGVIIRKLLDINKGSIQVIESNQSGNKTGTIQRIVINCEKG